MEILFWICAGLVLYIYLGYPALMSFLAGINSPMQTVTGEQPSVSILIAAYNEEDCIEATLQNKLELLYPRDRLEIVVMSDGSTDKTDHIVNSLSDKSEIPIRLFRQDRKGKTAALNVMQERAKGEILVFSDANSIYDKYALQNLVKNFSDSKVGYVTGKMLYVNHEGSLIGDGCSAYMKYENWIRSRESMIGSVVGVDGGIDAMRKSLYECLREDQLPDFVQPLKVVQKGYRVVYDPEALLKEETLANAAEEYSMRFRVTLRSLWGLHDMRQLFNPVRYGFFSVQLLSHKMLRYLAFIPIILMFMSNIYLLGDAVFYSVMLLGQGVFYSCAWLGWRYQQNTSASALITIPYYFVLLNIACLHAVWCYLKGEKITTWKPRLG